MYNSIYMILEKRETVLETECRTEVSQGWEVSL